MINHDTDSLNFLSLATPEQKQAANVAFTELWNRVLTDENMPVASKLSQGDGEEFDLLMERVGVDLAGSELESFRKSSGASGIEWRIYTFRSKALGASHTKQIQTLSLSAVLPVPDLNPETGVIFVYAPSEQGEDRTIALGHVDDKLSLLNVQQLKALTNA